MRALLERGSRLNEIGSEAVLEAAGSTVAGVADQNRSEAVAFLLSLGVDVNSKNKEGWTALLLAADQEDRAQWFERCWTEVRTSTPDAIVPGMLPEAGRR